MEKLNLAEVRRIARSARAAEKRRVAAQQRELERQERAREREVDRLALAEAAPLLREIKDKIYASARAGGEEICLFAGLLPRGGSTYKGDDYRRLDGVSRGLALWALRQGMRLEILMTPCGTSHMRTNLRAFW